MLDDSECSDCGVCVHVEGAMPFVVMAACWSVR